MAETMKAWLQHRYGGPETVAQEAAPVPVPGRGEVLVAVSATSLNSADVRLMRGEPLLLRLAFGLRRPRRPDRGMDVAGTVLAVGPDVSEARVGERVVGELPGGGLAPFAVAPAKRLVPIPEGVSMVDAAALPLAGGTAWQALEAGGVVGFVAGRRVLIVGASGGVGTFAVQLAAARGADVWALTGERSRGLVESLGAARTFDYRTTGLDDPQLHEAPFDAVVVIAGSLRLRALQSLVRDGGTVVLVSGDGGRVFGPIGAILRAGVLSIGSRRRLRALAATAKRDVLRSLLGEVDAGRLVPVIERTFPLGRAGEALAHIDAGHTLGKIVGTVD